MMSANMATVMLAVCMEPLEKHCNKLRAISQCQKMPQICIVCVMSILQQSKAIIRLCLILYV